MWCLPSLLVFVLFLFSFPIDRSIPFWPHWDLVTIYSIWFVFVAPVATVIAFVLFMKRRRQGQVVSFTRLLVWIALTLSVVVDLFMLLAVYSFGV